MKRRTITDFKFITAAMMLTIGLTGCGNQIPELTDEQAEKIGEYAAVTLLKYDVNQRSRLVDAETIEAYEQEQQEMQEQLTSLTPSPTPESAQEGMEPTADTPTVESGGGTGNTDNATVSIAECLAVPEGITITYSGYETCDTYPNGGSTDKYFNLDATSGKKLLVLKFSVENVSASEEKVDFFSANNIFSVDAGNGTKYNAMTTMLLNDMSTYAGTIPAGGIQDLALLFEVEQDVANSMTDVQLYFKNESTTYTIQL